MKFLIFILLFINTASLAQQLQGVVLDEETGEPLIGVNIKSGSVGTSSDTHGLFNLKLSKGEHQVTFTYIGYQSQVINVVINGDSRLEITMKPVSITTGEVVITARAENENIIKSIDQVSLSKEEMESLPAIMGQVDVVKSLQLLPGIQSAGEGNTGIFVRGGAIDQNLILLDGAPIYNIGHLFGFFSLFNPSIVREANLIKGGIPTSYGGRLSSILEVKSRPGNFRKYLGEASIGVVAGNIMLEGPLIKEKVSFLVSGRRTYIDLVSQAVTNDRTIFNTGIDYFFHDINARLDWRISQNSSLSLSHYSGEDDFLFNGVTSMENTMSWRNNISSMQWEYDFRQKGLLRAQIYRSHYDMNFGAAINDYLFNIISDIEDIGAKIDFEWQLEHHRLKAGTEVIHHRFLPNQMRANTSDIDFDFVEQEPLPARETAVYLYDNYQVNDRLSLNGGIRWSLYQQLGPLQRYITDPYLQITDTVHYEPNEVITSYQNWEPRLSITYLLNQSASLKASYDKTYQYVHMAPISSISLPTDVWVPSSETIQPQSAHQYSLGYFQNLEENVWETSLMAYYKTMQNQIEYRDGVIVGYSKGFNFDDNFIFGRGQSYGLELFVKKKKGKATGWVSYTLSRTTRSFPDINQGRTFPAKYDRLHNLSVVGNYKLNDRWRLSSVFAYATGNALTLPVGRYIINGNLINEYQGRNTFRMPAYHRLDFSATWQGKIKKGVQVSWVFSVYNLYNRRNPYYIFFETKGNINDYYLEVNARKVSLFPIIPSIAYQIKF